MNNSVNQNEVKRKRNRDARPHGTWRHVTRVLNRTDSWRFSLSLSLSLSLFRSSIGTGSADCCNRFVGNDVVVAVRPSFVIGRPTGYYRYLVRPRTFHRGPFRLFLSFIFFRGGFNLVSVPLSGRYRRPTKNGNHVCAVGRHLNDVAIVSVFV